VYERATREDLYESFDRRIAQPLGMEDWEPADGFRVFEPTKSRHPAHTFRISTRDLARFGQLYLQQGAWDGRQIVSADWVKESTQPHTDDGDGTGYGFMWWTYQAGAPFTARYPSLGKHTFFRAWGSGEQGLWVIPGAELVIAHRADTDHGRRVEGDDHWELVESILAARRSPPGPVPSRKPLQPTQLSSQLPPIHLPATRTTDRAMVEPWLGDYELNRESTRLGGYTLSQGGVVRIFMVENKSFVHLPGVGDVQIFATGQPDVFAARILPGMGIVFEGGTDESSAVTLTLDGDTLKASKTRRPRGSTP
jgi:CubicO group peptidase (beta-lactamase class C family)